MAQGGQTWGRGWHRDYTHTVTPKETSPDTQTLVTLATERLPRRDTLTGSDAHLGKPTQ